jgi:hypothetical protein
MNRTAESLTSDLQKAAIRGGWPKDVAAKLKAEHIGGLVVPTYEGDQEDIENLEFGTQKEAPKPVLNNFFQSHQTKQRLKKEATSQLADVTKSIQRLFS